MKNSDLNNEYLDDEIDLKELLRTIYSSKKLIILITLATTLLAFIYLAQKESKYESTVIIEVGSYDLNTGKKNLIEPVSDLLKELKIELFYKQQFSERQIKLDSIEDKLLQIIYNSPSPERNENLLKEVITFIQDRHEVILDKIVNSISNKKNGLNYLAAAEKEAINNKINAIDDEIPILKSKIGFLLELIPQEKENLVLLESALNPEPLLIRASSSPTLQQLIYTYNIDILDLKNLINTYKYKRSSLETELKMIEANNGSSDSSEKFLELFQKRSNLEYQEKLVKDSTNKTQLINKIQTVVVDKNELETILLFTIFGFIFSILIVLMREKYLKEWN